jgi:hypothetical protein
MNPERAPSKDRPYFQGSFQQVFSVLTDIVFYKRRSNWTVIVASEVGSKDNQGTYSGCLGTLTRNESDVAVALVDYPTDMFELLIPFQVITEDPVSITSAYTVKKAQKLISNDIIQASFHSFKSDLWNVILLAVILGGLVLFLLKTALQRRMKQRRASVWSNLSTSVFESFAHFLNQEYGDFADMKGKLISLTLAMGGFLLIVYWCNLMSGDLVIMPQPQTIDTFEQISERKNFSVYFIAPFTDYLDFKDADEGTVYKQIWEKNANKGKNIIEVDKDLGNILDYYEILLSGARGDVGIFITRLFMSGLVSSLCNLKSSFPGITTFANSFPHVATDPKARRHIKVAIHRRGAENIEILRNSFKRSRRSLEMDMLTPVTTSFSKGIEGPLFISNPSSIRECVWHAYNLPERNQITSALHIPNLKSIFDLFVVLLGAAILVLILELFASMCL